MNNKSVVMYVFNIFNPGGTSRSCINMIKNIQKNNSFKHIYIINYKGMVKQKQKDFYKSNEIEEDFVDFINIKDIPKIKEELVFLITREDFLPITEKTKNFKNIKYTIGEIHAPLEYIKDKYLFLENLDLVKVNTKKIAEEFKNKYNYENVIYNHVSLAHLNKISPKKISIKKEINFYVISRLEESSKNISYIISLVNYSKKRGEKLNLYIDGYGPDRKFYEDLIVELSLEENIFINSKDKPKDLVPISASKYETFGYSIVEGIYEYGTCLLYPGKDNNLKEIYEETNNIKYLTLNFEKDLEVIRTFKNDYDVEEENYAKILIAKLDDENYISNYIKKAKLVLENKKKYKVEVQKKEYKNLKKRTVKNNILSKNFLLKKIINKMRRVSIINKIFNKFDQIISKIKINKIKIDKDTYFIESFHGKNFTGNPKSLALEVSEENTNAKIYVSSINRFVDMEIYSYGFTPVRFNTKEYKKAYKRSKYIITNGNLILSLEKIKGQIHIQTWHGLPLKKMIHDLNDKIERKKQIKALKPRIKKWDYLLTAGGESTKLLKSAFDIKDNTGVEILEEGMPRVNYLKSIESDLIKDKYNIAKDKKVILFSPTWRNKKREKITNLNLIKLVEELEEMILVIKLHPLESHLRENYKNIHPRIIVPIQEFSDINELYAISDILISDYSSVIFDYMNLNKPIIINQEDEEDYKDQIGFYFDIEKETGLEGKKYTTEEIIKEIKENVNKEKNYDKFLGKYTPRDKTYKKGQIFKTINNK